MWAFRIRHIYAGSSDRPLVKVRPTGDASAESLARSPQEPAWTRISHERSARQSTELRPFRTVDRKQTSDKWRKGRTARRARHGSPHRPGGASKQGRRLENPDRARLAKERSRTSQPARPQLRRARDLIGPIDSRFTEGLATPDLILAKRMLEQTSAP